MFEVFIQEHPFVNSTATPESNAVLLKAMANVLRWARRWLQRSPSPVRQVASSGFRTFAPVEKIEEETLAWYSPDGFFPVRIGEVFHSKYQVLGKLGYGAYSTVWLCRDLG
jgi:hypothetical protein